ncbi:hypothetical protein MTO96_037691 [Rhipicephalus appendiculatus]
MSRGLRNILEWSAPQHMRNRMVIDYKANETSQWDELFAEKKPRSKEGYEGDKHKRAIVKEARVGSWKEYFTPQLLARFEKKIQEEGDNASFMELWKDIREEAIQLSRARNKDTRRKLNRLAAMAATRKPYTQIIDGVPCSPWVDPEAYRRSTSFRASKGDLVQSSYPKSGTHWVEYITQLILKNGDPIDTEAMNDDAKYIYVARNPWDVCVSIFHNMTNISIYRFQDGTFEDIVDPFLKGDLGYGSYFDHVASAYALRERAERQEGLLQKIIERSQPENMRKVIVFDLKGNENPGWRELFGRNEVSCKHGYGGDSTKYGLVRKAKVGGWKEHFTPDQLARFEKMIRELGDRASFMQLWSDIREEARSLSGLSA